MRSRITLALVILITIFISGSCSKKVAVDKSPAGAVVSDAAATARLFDRRSLNVNGFNHLADFIRPEVRERLDQEPVGSGEDGEVQAPAFTDRPYEDPAADQQEPYSEENPERELELDKAKYTWAKKKYGDALAADPTATGFIVLYADENFYDMGRLMHFVEDGRDRISSGSDIDGNRIQVVYGGYRGVAQVELWIVPAGQRMPEPKPEEKNSDTSPQN